MTQKRMPLPKYYQCHIDREELEKDALAALYAEGITVRVFGGRAFLVRQGKTAIPVEDLKIEFHSETI